jgi:hypothetical protein
MRCRYLLRLAIKKVIFCYRLIANRNSLKKDRQKEEKRNTLKQQQKEKK